VSQVSNGAAYAVVTGTGPLTEIGKINQGVQEAKQDATKTPLAQKLDEFGNTLTYIIGAICLGVWLFSIPEFDNPVHGSVFKGALYYAKVAVALGVSDSDRAPGAHSCWSSLPLSVGRALLASPSQVAAIPEGLPAVITLCLSLGKPSCLAPLNVLKPDWLIRRLRGVIVPMQAHGGWPSAT
jgi:P-type Ca2+ transporter type 2C